MANEDALQIQDDDLKDLLKTTFNLEDPGIGKCFINN